ncbi:MAG: hypothetical protein A2046_13570 [Bacteroidetes bacterium GWA2_30_7]|nr:MAG: hypothetical protein A2046_13570 [Bacteroidetes bacterium GWA2_30_7]
MKIQTLIFIIFVGIGLISCNEQQPKPTPKILQEQDSMLKILDEHDSIRIISNDSLKTRTVKSDTE